MVTGVKRLLLGRPLASYEEGGQRLPKRIGLAVFAQVRSAGGADDERRSRRRQPVTLRPGPHRRRAGTRAVP